MGRHALELDDSSAEIHRTLGSLSLYEKDFERSLNHFNRAIQLAPNHAYIVALSGLVHCYLGEGETALQYQRRALSLDRFLPEFCR
ncbi:MAG: tetratricopeptide repeat protein [Rhodobacteraceae bacterium]|nr:tetratricopeptide repeat protein [Paracoccaceae bacterium]